MLGFDPFRWLARRRAIRARWQADARQLIRHDERGAFYEAQRRAARARADGDRGEFWHWAKVASEVARLSPIAEMDQATIEAVVDAEMRR